MGMEPNGIYDWNALLQWTGDAQPHAMLVANNIERARQLYALMPAKTFMIHRKKEANDSRLHLIYTPEQFVTGLEDAPLLYQQVGNEPDGYGDLRDLIDWLMKVIPLAEKRHLKLALPAFGMGNPDDLLFDTAALDDLIYMIIYGGHLWIQHEYFVFNAPTEPYHVGRIKTVLNRIEFLRIRTPDLPDMKIVISEAGTDIGGGFGDGWRNRAATQGKEWTPEYYVARLLEQASVYAPLGVPMIVYCYGVGFDWRSFDIQDENFILSQLLEYNLKVSDESEAEMSTPLPAGTPVKQGTLTAMPSTAVNVRSDPNVGASTVRFQAKVGDKGSFATPSDYIGWYWYKDLSEREGWISFQSGAVVFTEDVTEPPPPPVVPSLLTATDLLNLAEAHTLIASIFMNAAKRGAS